MGNASYDDKSFRSYATGATKGKSQKEIFTQKRIHPDLDPTTFEFRECVDSPANPQAHPIILGCDETGSMGVLAEQIIRGDLGTIMRELYARKPVPNPQILCAGVGDHYTDEAPIQVTQFEADGIVLGEQIRKIFLEGNGGSNSGESYPMLWAFAGLKTRCDAITKRGRKGYLFTIGDEQPHLRRITSKEAREVLGVGVEADAEPRDILKALQQGWNVFHLIVKPVDYQPVERTWREVLGEKAITIHDTEKMPEIIVSTIQMMEGASGAEVIKSWAPETAKIVEGVVRQLTA